MFIAYILVLHSHWMESLHLSLDHKIVLHIIWVIIWIKIFSEAVTSHTFHKFNLNCRAYCYWALVFKVFSFIVFQPLNFPLPSRYCIVLLDVSNPCKNSGKYCNRSTYRRCQFWPKKIIFSYDAHFDLGWNVNKQYCRIWGTEIPQAYN